MGTGSARLENCGIVVFKIYLFYLHVCVSVQVYAVCVGTRGGQKSASDPLGLNLHVVII